MCVSDSLVSVLKDVKGADGRVVDISEAGVNRIWKESSR